MRIEFLETQKNMNKEHHIIYEKYKNEILTESPDRMVGYSPSGLEYDLHYRDPYAAPFFKLGGNYLFGWHDPKFVFFNKTCTHMGLAAVVITNLLFGKNPADQQWNGERIPENHAPHPFIKYILANVKDFINLFNDLKEEMINSLLNTSYDLFKIRNDSLTPVELYLDTINKLNANIKSDFIRTKLAPAGRCWVMTEDQPEWVAISTWAPVDRTDRDHIESAIKDHYNLTDPIFQWDKVSISSDELAQNHVEVDPVKRKTSTKKRTS